MTYDKSMHNRKTESVHVLIVNTMHSTCIHKHYVLLGIYNL